MTATFWTGSSLSFTNGTKTVTVNTGPSLDNVKPNSSLKAGNYNEPVEVKSVSGNTITLYNDWPGVTGTTSATIKPSAAAAASAGAAAQVLIEQIKTLVDNASVTVTANSFVKRDANGRIKAAPPASNDDVVNKGYIGTSATKNVGTSPGNVMEVGAGQWLSTSTSSISYDSYGDADLIPYTGIFYSSAGATLNRPSTAAGPILSIGGKDSTVTFQLYGRDENFKFRGMTLGNFYPWRTIYHSGNTNFNVFGEAASDEVGFGPNNSTTTAVIYLPLMSHTLPTGITVTGTFELRNAEGQVLATGISPSSFSLSSRASGRLAKISITGLAGLTPGAISVLVTESSSSKITVNF